MNFNNLCQPIAFTLRETHRHEDLRIAKSEFREIISRKLYKICTLRHNKKKKLKMNWVELRGMLRDTFLSFWKWFRFPTWPRIIQVKYIFQTLNSYQFVMFVFTNLAVIIYWQEVLNSFFRYTWYEITHLYIFIPLICSSLSIRKDALS